jgi:hypothetical protein
MDRRAEGPGWDRPPAGSLWKSHPSNRTSHGCRSFARVPLVPALSVSLTRPARPRCPPLTIGRATGQLALKGSCRPFRSAPAWRNSLAGEEAVRRPCVACGRGGAYVVAAQGWLAGRRRDRVCGPPGWIFIVGPRHSFADFAEAIDAALARWDLPHLHDFELADGRLIGFPDDSFEPDLVWLDHASPSRCASSSPATSSATCSLSATTSDTAASWSPRRSTRARRSSGVARCRIGRWPFRGGAGFATTTAAAASTPSTTRRTTRVE